MHGREGKRKKVLLYSVKKYLSKKVRYRFSKGGPFFLKKMVRADQFFTENFGPGDQYFHDQISGDSTTLGGNQLHCCHLCKVLTGQTALLSSLQGVDWPNSIKLAP